MRHHFSWFVLYDPRDDYKLQDIRYKANYASILADAIDDFLFNLEFETED